MKISQDNFLEAYEKYKNTVYSVIFNYVQNIDDTNDLQQEVFIKLLNSDVDYETDEHLRAWLIRVAINMCKNNARRSKYISGEAIPEDLPYEVKEDEIDVLSYVLALPEKYRIPVHLYYYQEYSIKEISELLDMSESTVKIRLKRGRDKLKKSLLKEEIV